ncbi:MAG: hypothetical protein ACK5HZ_11765 [Macellibacteroides fermentans]|uniref:hypothetical protein n=1 Tax=Macellibacteroides fermentans TaxID=879969 RepID=UPI003ACC234C
MKKIELLLLLFVFIISVNGQKKNEKHTIPLPTQAQLNWQNADLVAVFHYDLHVYDGVKYNQFHNRITPIPYINIFNSEKLDTDQWIRSVKAMGAGIAILCSLKQHFFVFKIFCTKIRFEEYKCLLSTV